MRLVPGQALTCLQNAHRRTPRFGAALCGCGNGVRAGRSERKRGGMGSALMTRRVLQRMNEGFFSCGMAGNPLAAVNAHFIDMVYLL